MTDLLKRIESGLDKCGVTTGTWGFFCNAENHEAWTVFDDSFLKRHVCLMSTGIPVEQRESTARLIAQCREAFKALIAIVYEGFRDEVIESGYPFVDATQQAMESWSAEIKVIEAGTGWTWQEWRRWIDE